MSKSLQAIVKWPGGKTLEAKKILPLIPSYSGRFIDPFVGGGAIYFVSQSKRAAINDLSEELIALYRYIQQGNNEFFHAIYELDHIRCSLCKIIEDDTIKFVSWFDFFSEGVFSQQELKGKITNWVSGQRHRLDKFTYDGIEKRGFSEELIKNFSRKLSRMKKLSEENGGLDNADIIENIETAIHSAFYMYVRHLYNNSERLNLSKALAIAIFYYIREFCYSSMFRFNNDGHFNVPYGGMAYNTKDFNSKIYRIQQPIYQEYLAGAKIHNTDFSEFFELISPQNNDFIFLDPPYDSDFSTYDGNSFEKEDHERLADFMVKTSANFLMVIKNTDFVMNLYGAISNVQVQVFDKKYMVSFQNRNDKRAKHLIITNYPLPVPVTPRMF